MTNIAIENGHWNRGFSHQKWWIFPVRYVKLSEGTYQHDQTLSQDSWSQKSDNCYPPPQKKNNNALLLNGLTISGTPPSHSNGSSCTLDWGVYSSM